MTQGWVSSDYANEYAHLRVMTGCSVTHDRTTRVTTDTRQLREIWGGSRSEFMSEYAHLAAMTRPPEGQW